MKQTIAEIMYLVIIVMMTALMTAFIFLVVLNTRRVMDYPGLHSGFTTMHKLLGIPFFVVPFLGLFNAFLVHMKHKSLKR